MKCPLTIDKGRETITGQKPHASDCLKEECAWWEQDCNLCAIKELALEVRYTQQRLQELTMWLLPEWVSEGL